MLLFSTFIPSFTYATGEVETELNNNGFSNTEETAYDTDITDQSQIVVDLEKQVQSDNNSDNDDAVDIGTSTNQENQTTSDTQVNNGILELTEIPEEFDNNDKNQSESEAFLSN